MPCVTTIQRPLRVPHGPFSESDTKSLASLYISAKSNLRDRVSGEVEKNSFVDVSGKGGLRGLAYALKTMCPDLEGLVRSFTVMIQRGCDQLVDILLIDWWRDNHSKL